MQASHKNTYIALNEVERHSALAGKLRKMIEGATGRLLNHCGLPQSGDSVEADALRTAYLRGQISVLRAILKDLSAGPDGSAVSEDESPQP